MSVVTVLDNSPRVQVVAAGGQGPAGPSNLIIAEADPGLTQPGLWVQVFPDGDMTFWIEDGS